MPLPTNRRPEIDYVSASDLNTIAAAINAASSDIASLKSTVAALSATGSSTAPTFPVSDTFAGGVTSSAPPGWALVSATGSVAVDSSARMVLTTPATPGPVLVAWQKMLATADVQLTAEVTFPTLGAQYAVASLRSSTPKADNFPNDGYSLELRPAENAWFLFKNSGGSRATMANGAFTFAANVPVKVKLVVSAANVQARIWTGATEPSTWQYNDVDYLVSSPGILMLGSYTGVSGTAAVSAWDSIVVSAPTGVVGPSSVGSGVAMPTTSSRPGWSYSYGQDFSAPAALGQFGSVYGASWAGFDGAKDTSKFGTYRPNKSLSAADSMLRIRCFYDAATAEFVGANMFPQPPAGVNGGSQEYTGMRVSVRYKATGAGAGWKTAWMLYPATFLWQDGEIDWVEGGLGGTIGAFSHPSPCYADPNSPTSGLPYCGVNQLAVSSQAVYTDWHTSTVEWIPKTANQSGSVEFFLDGVSLGKTTTNVPSKAMHPQLQTETWLSSTRPPEASAWDLYVDWLVVEAYTG